MAATPAPSNNAAPQTRIAASVSNSSATELSFPQNIKNAAYYTRLTLKKYNRNRPSSSVTETVTASIILPIPEGFGDQQTPNWHGDNLGIFGASWDEFKSAADALKRTGGSIFNDAANGSGVNAIKTAALAAGTFAAVISPTQMRDGQIQNRISQQMGVVVNPHLSLMFQGMPLRQHSLGWKFAPRNAQEAKALGDIINKLRVQSLPSYDPTVSKFALQYPDTCEVEFVNIDTNYKSKIFKSGITGLTTNLGPSGIAFYPSGVPVEVEMNLTLTETEIVTREDFGGKPS